MGGVEYNPVKWTNKGKGIWDIDPFGLVPEAPEAPDAPTLTPPPKSKEQEAVRRKQNRGLGDFTGLGTILTGPQGASPLGALIPSTKKKTLLGQ